MLTLAALLTTLIAMSPLPEGVSDDDPSRRGPRVRPYDSRAATLLLNGMERSDTMRAIVDRLEELDVIVYLEVQPSVRGSLAGRLTWLTRTELHRFVRVSLNPTLPPNILIATLAHELQHALEIALAPSIIDDESLSAYYRQHGMKSPGRLDGWDTLAAQDVGDRVRRELAGVRTARVAESIQPFLQEEWHIVYRRARSMLPP